MKKSILKFVAAFVCGCFLLNLTSPCLKDTGLGWINLDNLTLRNNFYFRKGQWLADGRTIVAAIRFLYQTRPGNSQGPIDAALPSLPATQPRLDTNIVAYNETEPRILLQQRRLSRIENLIVRNRVLRSVGPPPLFAVADTSVNDQNDLPVLDWKIGSPPVTIGTQSVQIASVPTNVALPRLGAVPPSA